MEIVRRVVKRDFGEIEPSPNRLSRSFFRGDNCNFNPRFLDFGATDFLENHLVKGWIPSAKPLDPATYITAFGSCFAAHITQHLRSVGYNLSQGRDPEIYISAIGEGLVNTFAILQQFEWALTSVAPPENLWHGYKAEIFGYNEEVRERTRKVFLETEFFIITLGLSEIWYDEVSGGVFWRAVPQARYDPSRHKFRVCSFEETKANIAKIYKLIQEHVPKAKVLFTLSPVPLAATFRPASCITANSASKSLLRGALDEFYRDNWADVNQTLFYFPSYEIISALFANPFQEDNRHPRPEIASFTMELFETLYCKSSRTMAEMNTGYHALRIENVEFLLDALKSSPSKA